MIKINPRKISVKQITKTKKNRMEAITVLGNVIFSTLSADATMEMTAGLYTNCDHHVDGEWIVEESWRSKTNW